MMASASRGGGRGRRGLLRPRFLLPSPARKWACPYLVIAPTACASAAACVDIVSVDGACLRSTAAAPTTNLLCAGPDWCSGWSATRLACAARAGHLLEAYAGETPALQS